MTGTGPAASIQHVIRRLYVPPPRPQIQLVQRTASDTITANAPQRSRQERLSRTPTRASQRYYSAKQRFAAKHESRLAE